MIGYIQSLYWLWNIYGGGAGLSGVYFITKHKHCIARSWAMGLSCLNILKPRFNWSPYIVRLVQKVKQRVFNIHAFMNEAILCLDSANYFI